MLKKAFEKLYFGWYPVLRFVKCVYYTLFVVGIVLGGAFYFYQDRAKALEEALNIALIESWQQNADETYLNVHYVVDEIPILFTKENVCEIVRKKVQPHNYVVDARRVNQKNGFYVKPKIRFSDKVRAYYTEDVEVNGQTEPTVWLLSEGYINKHNLEESLSKYEIEIPK